MLLADQFEWAVVGAGPAGIAAVGKLLDQGVDAKNILWIDPKFAVGDFGTLWKNVPSNTKVELFLKFLNECQSFNYKNFKKTFKLNTLNKNDTCEIHTMAEPLQWITDHLKQRVINFKNTVEYLSLQKKSWMLKTKENNFQAKNVILAIGALPKTLSYSDPKIIPLSIAMDKVKLKKSLNKSDVVAVFGSSHSAVLALKNCVELNVSKIINFYRRPLIYAIPFENWILFDDTGLKGIAAKWARENIDGKLPPNLERAISNAENIEHYLSQCNKVIYAIGFEKRNLPIEGLAHLEYNEHVGIIAPGLFGLGIAFPQKKQNPFGIIEHRVGLWKFMDYLNQVLPVWLKYSV